MRIRYQIEDQKDNINRLEEEKKKLVQNLMQITVSQNKMPSYKNIEDSTTIDLKAEQHGYLESELSKAKEEIEKLKKKNLRGEKVKELKEEIDSLQEEKLSQEKMFHERKKEDKKKIIELEEAVEKLKRKKTTLKSEIVNLKATIELLNLNVKERPKDKN